jgi:hypothetical protein
MFLVGAVAPLILVLGGSLFWETSWAAEHTALAVILNVIVVLILIVLMVRMFLAPYAKLKALKGTGLRAEAIVLAAPTLDSGVANVAGEVRLRVRLKGQEPYLANTLAMVPAGRYQAMFQIPFPIWVDPKDPQKVYIDWDDVATNDQLIKRQHEAMLAAEQAGPIPGPTQTSGAAPDDPVAQLERLVALRDSGALDGAEFEKMKQRIVDADG